MNSWRMGMVAAIGAVGLLVPATAIAPLAQAEPGLERLSLQVGAPAAFGAFSAGEARTYESSTTANVNSTADVTTLTVHDGSDVAVGQLVNGAFSLPQKLQARARNAANLTTPFSELPGVDSPLGLLTYHGPASNDAFSLQYRQVIGAGDALSAGTYAKTLTLTLSTTTPCAMSVTVSTTVSGTVVEPGGALTSGPASASASCTPNPPDCSAVAAIPGTIQPATRDQLQQVTLSGATDADGGSLGYRVDAVTQDEPVTGRGDDTSPDAERTADQVRVRAERNPQGDGRVYRIAFTVTDPGDLSCTGIASVSVPRRKGTTAVDGGDTGSWDSFTEAKLLR